MLTQAAILYDGHLATPICSTAGITTRHGPYYHNPWRAPPDPGLEGFRGGCWFFAGYQSPVLFRECRSKSECQCQTDIQPRFCLAGRRVFSHWQNLQPMFRRANLQKGSKLTAPQQPLPLVMV